MLCEFSFRSLRSGESIFSRGIVFGLPGREATRFGELMGDDDVGMVGFRSSCRGGWGDDDTLSISASLSDNRPLVLLLLLLPQSRSSFPSECFMMRSSVRRVLLSISCWIQ